MRLDQILITSANVEGAVLRLRGGSVVDAGAAILLELVWSGARRRQLEALTSTAISWPPSATLRALARPDIVLQLPSKRPGQVSSPMRPSPEAAAWIAKRSKAAPHPELLFTEPMFRSALRALQAEVGAKVSLLHLRRSVSIWLLLHASMEAAGDAIGSVRS